MSAVDGSIDRLRDVMSPAPSTGRRLWMIGAAIAVTAAVRFAGGELLPSDAELEALSRDEVMRYAPAALAMAGVQAASTVTALYIGAKGIVHWLSRADRELPGDLVASVRQKAKDVVAHKDGKMGVWIVHDPRAQRPVAMSEKEFRRYEKGLADTGRALDKLHVSFLGKIVLTRQEGGKLHSDDGPAVTVLDAASGVSSKSYYREGQSVSPAGSAPAGPPRDGAAYRA